MADAIEILVGDVNDVEAQIIARIVDESTNNRSSASEAIVMRGTVRGPFCNQAQTLPAEFKFRDLGPQQGGIAEVVIPDPCLWSPELPQLYQVDVAAFRGEQIVAEYHGQVGLKRATPRRSGIEFPG